MRNHIRKLREELNISQDQLAREADIGIEELDAIENGRLEPSLVDAHRITKALKKDFIADVFIFDE